MGNTIRTTTTCSVFRGCEDVGHHRKIINREKFEPGEASQKDAGSFRHRIGLEKRPDKEA